MDKLTKKRLGGIAAVAAVVGWLGIPITLQRFYSVPALESAFAITVIYWLTLQLYKRRS